MWKDISSEWSIGSEGGTVLLDEEYKSACRITLERCERYYAITCGVYGAMVHTVFCGADNCQEKYEQMKAELQQFIDTDTTWEEESAFYDSFKIGRAHV